MKADFDKLIPPMPSTYLATMERTLKEAEDMSKIRRHKQRVTLALALICALLLASIGYAATHSGLLAYLFGDQPAPDAIAQAVEKPGLVFEGDGVTVTIDELLRTDDRLTVFWTVESNLDEPVLYCTTRPTVNRMDPYMDNFSQEATGGHCLYLLGDVDGQSYPKTRSGYVTAKVSGDGTALFRMTAQFYRPHAPMLILPYEQLYDSIMIGPEAPYYDKHYPDEDRLYLELREGEPPHVLPNLYPNAGDSDEKAVYLEQLGLIALATQLDVAFEVEPAQFKARHTRPTGTRANSLEGLQLKINSLDFADGGTTASFTVWDPSGQRLNARETEPGYYEALDAHCAALYARWMDQYELEIQDAKGNALLDARDGFEGWNLYECKTVDGRPALYIEGKWLPVAQAPGQVVIMPMRYDPAARRYNPIPEAAFTMGVEGIH